MDRNILETQWPQIRDILNEKFSNLTEEDIRQINGRYDQLVSKLQQKYGYTREEAEDRIRNWNFDQFKNHENKSYRAERLQNRERQDTAPSFLTWLLVLGIPLLLLGTYLLSPSMREPTTTAPSNQEQAGQAASMSDVTLGNNIRAALETRAADMQNVQVMARNGIVTLSGTVPTAEARDAIVNTTQNVAGVQQVINNLQVR